LIAPPGRHPRPERAQPTGTAGPHPAGSVEGHLRAEHAGRVVAVAPGRSTERTTALLVLSTIRSGAGGGKESPNHMAFITALPTPRTEDDRPPAALSSCAAVLRHAIHRRAARRVATRGVPTGNRVVGGTPDGNSPARPAVPSARTTRCTGPVRSLRASSPIAAGGARCATDRQPQPATRPHRAARKMGPASVEHLPVVRPMASVSVNFHTAL